MVLAAFSYWLVFVEVLIVVIIVQNELLYAKLQDDVLQKVGVVYIVLKRNSPELNIGNFDAT